jgi:hypothetical protein
MIGQALCTMPVAAQIAPATPVSTDDFRLVDILCRFAAQTVRAARYAPIQHINICRLFSFVENTVFNATLSHPALWKPVSAHAALFQPEET